LAVGTAAVALTALPALASATVYCVPNNSVDGSCQTPEATVDDALSAAHASAATPDTVRIGAGTFNVVAPGSSYFGNSGNTLQLIGAGTGQTTLSMVNSAGSTTGLDLNLPTGSAVSDFTLSIPDDGDATTDIGIDLQGSATVSHVNVSGPTTDNTQAIQLSGTPTLSHINISLKNPSPSGNSGFSGGSDATITDSTISADYGIQHSGGNETVSLRRSTILASVWGIHLDSGTVDVSDTLINLLGSGGAAGIVPTNFNSGSTPINANIDGVTIVNGGLNSRGVEAIADSEQVPPPGDTGTQAERDDMVDDGEDSTTTLANSVISGVAHPLVVESDRGQTASLTATYSNYDPSGDVVSNDLSGADATGTTTLNVSNQTDLLPSFVDPGNGDYHLQEASGLIDAGDPAHPDPARQDIDGDSREIFGKSSCFGARRDIGADEVVPTTPPTLLDCTPPETSIASGPSGTTAHNTPTFTFTSTESPSTYRCSVDGSPAAPCATPFTSAALSDGAHMLAVQAIDSSLNVDPTPATRSFVVDTRAPETAIGSHPKPKTKSRRGSFSFSSSEQGSSFLCSYDGQPYAACSSPFSTPKLKPGRHRFDVLATDAAGNRDPSPATFLWKVKKPVHR